MTTTYDVRFWKTAVYKGSTKRTHAVRWVVGGKHFRKTYGTKAAADAHRSELIAAHRRGEQFDLESGLPRSTMRTQNSMSWYDLVCKFVDAKWIAASPSLRVAIADAITDVTEELLTKDISDCPDPSMLRPVLRHWCGNARARQENKHPPQEMIVTAAWLRKATINVADLESPSRSSTLVRCVLERINRKQDGTFAATSTFVKKRAIFVSVLTYALEIGVLQGNPIERVSWARPYKNAVVDPAIVVNSGQARKLISAVGELGPVGQRLMAFFACIYFAGLRPEEAMPLSVQHLLSLPDAGWGQMRVDLAQPYAGKHWTDSKTTRESRQLKHRAKGVARFVPVHPELVSILREHIEQFVAAEGGPLFIGPLGGNAAYNYRRFWTKARDRVFSIDELNSPLGRRPYDLRHACLSTWLAAGVPAPQVAEWAGHSVQTLLTTYAKCIAGQQDDAMRRIVEVMR